MRRSLRVHQQGFLVVTVVLVLAVLAAMALMLATSTSLDNAVNAKHAEGATLDYVANSAVEHMTWQLAQNTSCTNYASLPVTPFGQHSYWASPTPTSGSPVSISAVGRLAAGAEHTASRDNVKSYQASSTLFLQPGSEGDDAEIWDQDPDRNYGDSAETWVSSAAGDTTRTLLRFKLPGIPAAATVLSATLSLSHQSGSKKDEPVSAHRITNQWNEAAVSWNSRESATNWDTAGGDFEKIAIATTPIGPPNERFEWNITPLVQAWVDGSYPNYGVALVAATKDMEGERFYTSDESDIDKRPSLDVTYACECGIGGSSGTTTLQPGPGGKDTFLNSFGARAVSSYGGENLITVAESSAKHGLLEFDVSALPAGAFVTSAILEIYAASNGNNGGVMSAYQLTQSWLEGTTSAPGASTDGASWDSHDAVNSWATAGGDYDPTPASQVTLTGASNWVSLDVSALVAAWVDGSKPNFGLLLQAGAGFGSADFYSSDHSTPSERPKLTVNYTCPCGATCIASPGGAGTAGLIAHWKLDETSGTSAVDSVGGYDGTLMNGPAWAAGKLDGGLSLDGVNDYIDVSSMNPMSYDDFTVSAWYKSADSGVSDDEYIFEHSENWVNEVTFGPTDDIAGDRLRFGFASGGSGTWDPHYGTSDIVDQQWHLLVGVRSGGRIKLYVDGVEEADGVDAHAGVTIAIDGDGPFIGDLPGSTEQVHGIVDDVRLFDRALSATEIAELFASGDGGSDPGYIEVYQPWSATSNDTWESMDLAPFGVPANAVVEVAVINSDAGKQLWGGVRKVGSSLDRRLQLHEPESGGTDVMVLHVQADASSRIEHYSDTPSDVTFILLGYWDSGTFVESWELFDAGASNAWQDHALASYGVSPGAVAEILMLNEVQSPELRGGVRTAGSTAQRLFDIHEAESGGMDFLTLLTTAGTDAGATIEVFAEDDSAVDFYLSGHWSTPPGVYTEAHILLPGSPASNGAWDDKDLSGLGVPANAVAQIVMANGEDAKEAQLGVRESGSAYERTVNLQEAEAGGDDLASAHVNASADSSIQWYDQNTGEDHRFYLLGWWVLAP